MSAIQIASLLFVGLSCVLGLRQAAKDLLDPGHEIIWDRVSTTLPDPDRVD